MVRTISLGLLAVFLVLADGEAGAATLSGRLTTSAYSWKVQEIDGTDARHLRLYQSVITNVRGIGGGALSLHTYGQMSGDLLDEAPGRTKYRIYHAYLQWRPKGRLGLGMTAGRQRIYGGVGFGTLDGVRGKVSPRP